MTKIDQASFINRVLESIPKPAMGFMGVMVGATLCFVFILTVGDLKGPFARVVDAQVKQIEGATANLKDATKHLTEVVKRIEVLESAVAVQQMESAKVFDRLKNVEDRVFKVETFVKQHEARRHAR